MTGPDVPAEAYGFSLPESWITSASSHGPNTALPDVLDALGDHAWTGMRLSALNIIDATLTVDAVSRAADVEARTHDGWALSFESSAGRRAWVEECWLTGEPGSAIEHRIRVSVDQDQLDYVISFEISSFNQVTASTLLFDVVDIAYSAGIASLTGIDRAANTVERVFL